MIKTVALLFLLFGAVASQRPDELVAWSTQALNRFWEVQRFKDFWKRGNCADSVVNLVNQLEKHQVSEKLTRSTISLLKLNLDYFAAIDPDQKWADDFGWWGLLGIRAHAYLLKHEEITMSKQYLTLAIDCWKAMLKAGYDYSDTAEPVPHGCANGNIGFEGVKNTVTNALLLLLSTRLYLVTEELKYLDVAINQWLWFSRWFNLTQYQYLRSLRNGGILVQERPLVAGRSGYNNTQHPPWEPGLVWSGDQGLLIAALQNLLIIPTERSRINESIMRSLLAALIRGVNEALIGEDGIVREAPFNLTYSSEFGIDYIAGRGLLARYHQRFPVSPTVRALWATRNQYACQFRARFTSPESDKAYFSKFKEEWTEGDRVGEWNLTKGDEMERDAVTQTVGLDFLAAALYWIRHPIPPLDRR